MELSEILRKRLLIRPHVQMQQPAKSKKKMAESPKSISDFSRQSTVKVTPCRSKAHSSKKAGSVQQAEKHEVNQPILSLTHKRCPCCAVRMSTKNTEMSPFRYSTSPEPQRIQMTTRRSHPCLNHDCQMPCGT